MTAEHATFIPNGTDTAVLIAPPGGRDSPRWAFVAHQSAHEAIESEQLRRDRLQRARARRDIGILAGVAATWGALLLLRELGVGVSVPVWAVAGVLSLSLLSRVVTDPRPRRPASEDDVQRTIARLLAEREALTVCSVELARQLSVAQHHALTVAASFGLTREVLETLQEQLETRKREKDQCAEQHRRAQALAIVEEHTTSN